MRVGRELIWFKAGPNLKVDPTSELSEVVQRLVQLSVEYPRVEIPPLFLNPVYSSL